MRVVLPTMEVSMGSSEVPPPPTQSSPEFKLLSSRAIVAGPSGSLAIVARPWAGSASDPHRSQPIANQHRAGLHHSFSDQWLVVCLGLVNDKERHPPRAYGHRGLRLVTVTPIRFLTIWWHVAFR